MSFGNGSALLWLVPLAGAIILLYLLKMRRKDLRVPATFLWPALTYEIRANSLFQRLRFSWLLVLQLLALLLILFGLAQPQRREEGLAGDVTVLVIDASASMGATDVPPSRFEEAREIARGIIDTVKAGDRVSIIEAGPAPRVIAALSNDSSKLRRALDSLEQTDANCDVGSALRLASSLTSRQPNARVVLLSDGVFPEVRNFSAGKARLIFHKIGISAENTSISALGVTETSAGRQLYCGLKNHGLNSSSGSVDLFADGKLFNSFKVTIQAGAGKGETLAAPKNAKVIEARLRLDDMLPADNYAVTIADPGAVVRTLLIGKGDLFLERALALEPRVVLDRAAELPQTERAGEGESAYDLVIFDGTPEQAVKARAVLTLGRAGPSSAVTVSGTARQPRFIASEEHAALSSVDLRNTYIDSAERVRPKAAARVLAEGSGGPLVVFRAGAKRQLYIAFRPLDSDFPLQVGFPIFIANALDVLVPREQGSAALAIPAGKTISVPARDKTVLRVESPDKTTTEIEPTGGSYVIREANRVGAYRILDGKTSRPLYVSFASETESGIAPIDQVLLGGESVAAEGTVLRLADLWRPYLVFALLVLAGEWWLFARRS